MKDCMFGLMVGLVLAMSVALWVVECENSTLRHRNMNLVDKITEIQSDQAKLALIEQNALRRKVRKIAAKEAAK